jgi:hypothetical protein
MRHICAHFGGLHTGHSSLSTPSDTFTGPATACAMAPTKAKDFVVGPSKMQSQRLTGDSYYFNLGGDDTPEPPVLAYIGSIVLWAYPAHPHTPNFCTLSRAAFLELSRAPVAAPLTGLTLNPFRTIRMLYRLCNYISHNNRKFPLLLPPDLKSPPCTPEVCCTRPRHS